MASACAPQECDEKSETKNIVCCLQFLANEAENADLPVVSKIIGNAVTRISKLETHEQQHDIDRDFAELVCAFKTFVKFYLLGNHAAREELIELISNMDRRGLEAYVN